MQLSKKVGITPEVWGNTTLKEFMAKFKGYLSDTELKAKHKECVAIYKKSLPKKGK